MSKTFAVITENQTLVCSGKTTLINTGSTNVHLTDQDTDLGLASLPYDQQQSVKNALYAIKPGESKSLASNTYNIGFTMGGSAVIMKEIASSSAVPVDEPAA
ncbi:hypothetical protein [Spirosoma linguale]|uniref:Uncharacterized protein n=1 Tax=Spirosoma linguale (strain ATCC 33905 / DSM 74 / LMG 10896 / Claus 1) TaxID=504472 RepID=D2QGD7_SPILD|nr:hypothetical protein Slin_0681 [Spirosoma linguale DSM 74]